MKAGRRTIFIIPGFKHTPARKSYKTIAAAFKKQGYLPIPVTIPWKQNTISQNTDYFLEEYKKVKSSKKYILGFSYGAMIAFLASTKTDVSGLILCSLSPYFREDLPKKKNKNNDFTKLRFNYLAKKIKAKQTLMLYGQDEAKSLIKRVKDAFEKISSSNKYLISIKDTQHNISDKKYLNTIHKASKVLN